jgi:hypothetical protein
MGRSSSPRQPWMGRHKGFGRPAVLFLILFCHFWAGGGSLAQVTTSDGALLPPASPPEIHEPSVFRTITLIGPWNFWRPDSTFGRLRSIGGSHWEGYERFPAGTYSFRFVANQSWDHFWGAASGTPDSGENASQSGTAVPKGGNLRVAFPQTGQYRIRFEEREARWQFDRADGALPPIAHAGEDQQVGIGTIVTFDGRRSYDPDGTIASFTWDNGLTGPTPSLLYDRPGFTPSC